MHSNKIWKTWAMVHTEFWGKKQGLFIFSRTCLFDIEWHLPFTPAVLFVFFVSGVIFQRALLTSHTSYTKFFSCQPWMNSPGLCIEGQITIYYCTDTDPSAVLTVSPPLFQFKTILKILVLQFHVKVSRPFKYIGGGGGGGVRFFW